MDRVAFITTINYPFGKGAAPNSWLDKLQNTIKQI
jgi:hypothetical protein